MKINKTVSPAKVKAAAKRIIQIQRMLDTKVKALYKEMDECTNLIAAVFVRKTGATYQIKTKLEHRGKVIRFVPMFWNDKSDSVKVTNWKSSAQHSFAVTID